MEAIKSLIEKIGLDNEECIALEKSLTKLQLSKNEFLIREGETCSFIGFLESGALRSYIKKDGAEFNIDFYFPEPFVSSYTSYLTQTPAIGDIQALTESVVYILNISDYNKLIQTNPRFYLLGKYISDSLFKRFYFENILKTEN